MDVITYTVRPGRLRWRCCGAVDRRAGPALDAGVRHRQMPITVASERRHREEPTYLSFT
jgi:hypothetical protein